MSQARMWSSQDLVTSRKILDPSRKTEYLTVGVVVILFFTAGILIGRYGTDHDPPTLYDIKPWLIDEISANQIGSNLRYLTRTPHVAGTAQDLIQAEWIKERFLEAGLDEAKTIPYDVLLSYPKPGVMNTVSLIDDHGRMNFTTAGRQIPLGSPEEFSDEIVPNFNAFSASGVVEGNVVYAHYGRKKDYEYLETRGINVSGHIVLIRLGAIFRGSKVDLAERRGAIGVILFSDRQEKTSQNRNFTYPDSMWMPSTGAEYGHVGHLRGGDLLTPFYPAIASAFRIQEKDHPGLPKIPVQSIGYEEAETILRNISPENVAPSNWMGKMDVPYNLGPNLRYPGWKIRLDVSTNNQIRTTFNTIGILRGSIEDDRYVLLGNHRDSWAFGALDPSSGTASMIEIARVFGKLKTSKNWRPRRTIVFCSWGAKEYGRIGSYEWTQQHAKVLGQRAVAYLNVDTAVSGNRTLYGEAFPTLKQLLIDTAKLIPNPNVAEVKAGRTTIYDTWMVQVPDRNTYKQPMVGILGGGSDYEGFAYVVGVPSVDFGYTANGAYPTRHSIYDTYHLASNIIDRGFVHHQAVARMWAAAAATLADSVILPFDIHAYGQYLNESLSSLETQFGDHFRQSSVTLKHVKASLDHFLYAVKKFVDVHLKHVDHTDVMAVRKVNDKLMFLERFFIDPVGLPDHPETNHIVFSTSVSDSHNFRSFAGLVDLVVQVENVSESEDPETWAKIQHHLSVIAFFVGEAARSLVGDF